MSEDVTSEKLNFQAPNYAVRTNRLKELGIDTYEAYLGTDWWRERKFKFMQAVPPRCAFCHRDSGVVLNLHHTSYARLGKEDDTDLMWLCSDHHEELHEVGYIGPPSPAMRTILRKHGYTWDMVARMSFRDAWSLIDRIGRREAVTPNDLSERQARAFKSDGKEASSDDAMEDDVGVIWLSGVR